MGLTKEAIEEYKEIYRKQYGKDIDDQKASDEAYALIHFVKALQDSAMNNAIKKSRLKEKPEGFPVDGYYTCIVCGISINPETGWFDEFGSKCMPCTKALRNKVIPSYICSHHDSYFRMWQLKDVYKLTTGVIRKLIKEGKLIPRNILNDNGTVYEQIFLKADNPGLIQRHSPERKSYNRHRAKVDKVWVREQTKKLKAERRKSHNRKK